MGEAKGLKGTRLAKQIEAVMEQTKISEVKNRRIFDLSKGYRQRVGIAQALLGNPRVIILDEPTVGLDPIQIIEIRALIKELGRDHTVILSSHILSEVQAICDQILIIAKGKLLAFDEPGNLEKQFLTSNEILIRSDAPAGEVEAVLRTVEGAVGLPSQKTADIRKDGSEAATAIFTTYPVRSSSPLPGAGKALLEMSVKKATLEDVFIELTESGVEEE